MSFAEQFKVKLNNIQDYSFNELALELFQYQSKNNPIYKTFIQYLKINPLSIKLINDIPFLPIEFFKNHTIYCSTDKPKNFYSSSGTTGQITSKHYYTDEQFYLSHSQRIFESTYKIKLSNCIILGLLPSYLERSGSSLVTMCKHFIEKSQDASSGFYLYNHDDLANVINKTSSSEKKVFLFGVTFGLLDFVEKYNFHKLDNLTIIETGGMKGRRKEIIREEVHRNLTKAFNLDVIHSEYGMTELLSQAYSLGNGLYKQNAYLKILLRDIQDPLTTKKNGRGCINAIDLANIDSCAFIATQDLVNLHDNDEFEVLGRIDNSDTRGCNLMVSSI